MTGVSSPTKQKNRRVRSLPLFAILTATACIYARNSLASTQIPRLHGTTFAGAKIDLPEALHGKLGVFVIGFSQDSRDDVTAWGKRLASDFYDSQNIAYYEMPVLASVPKLLRGFVEGRIRASVSDRGKPHFLPITENESAWRSLVHFSDPNLPYILVVDEQGTVRWQTQGAPTEATYATLKQQLETFRPR